MGKCLQRRALQDVLAAASSDLLCSTCASRLIIHEFCTVPELPSLEGFKAILGSSMCHLNAAALVGVPTCLRMLMSLADSECKGRRETCSKSKAEISGGLVVPGGQYSYFCIRMCLNIFRS